MLRETDERLERMRQASLKDMRWFLDVTARRRGGLRPEHEDERVTAGSYQGVSEAASSQFWYRFEEQAESLPADVLQRIAAQWEQIEAELQRLSGPVRGARRHLRQRFRKLATYLAFVLFPALSHSANGVARSRVCSVLEAWVRFLRSKPNLFRGEWTGKGVDLDYAIFPLCSAVFYVHRENSCDCHRVNSDL
jgi:hypothetical protein